MDNKKRKNLMATWKDMGSSDSDVKEAHIGFLANTYSN